MAKYQITADEKVEIWQKVVYEVEAKNEKEAKEKLKKTPKALATNVEEIYHDTEKVLEIDFTNTSYDCVKIKK